VIKILIAGIYSFEGYSYNPLRISILGLAYISVPLLLTSLLSLRLPNRGQIQRYLQKRCFWDVYYTNALIGMILNKAVGAEVVPTRANEISRVPADIPRKPDIV
jgi:hypothetical protein